MPLPSIAAHHFGSEAPLKSAKLARLLLAMFACAPLFAACEPQVYGDAEFATNSGPGAPLNWSDPDDHSCEFPREADSAKIDAAEVVIRVLVRSDGSPQAVQTLDEPGYGFGTAATRCAMARKYTPGHDDRGKPIAAWTPPLHLRFVR